MAVPLSTIEGLPYLGGNSPGFVSVDSSGLQRLKKSKLDAVADPTTLDDSGAGYAVGSRWVNTASGKVWECVDASPLGAVWKDLTAVSPPAGSGTELQYRNGSSFGAVSGSSVSGSDVTIAGLQIGASAGSGRGIGLGTAPPGSGGYNIIKSAGGIFLQPASADSVFVRGSAVGSSRPLAWCDVGNNALVSLTPGSGTLTLNGNLGIGITPSSPIHVSGNDGFGVSIRASGDIFSAGAFSGGRLNSAYSSNAISFGSGNIELRAASSGIVEINNGTAGQYRDIQVRSAKIGTGEINSSGYWFAPTGSSIGLVSRAPNILLGQYGVSSVTLAPDTANGTATINLTGLGTVSGSNIQIDGSLVAGETRFLLYDVETAQLQRVLVGANGTGPGGVGRALYLAAA